MPPPGPALAPLLQLQPHSETARQAEAGAPGAWDATQEGAEAGGDAGRAAGGGGAPRSQAGDGGAQRSQAGAQGAGAGLEGAPAGLGAPGGSGAVLQLPWRANEAGDEGGAAGGQGAGGQGAAAAEAEAAQGLQQEPRPAASAGDACAQLERQQDGGAQQRHGAPWEEERAQQGLPHGPRQGQEQEQEQEQELEQRQACEGRVGAEGLAGQGVAPDGRGAPGAAWVHASLQSKSPAAAGAGTVEAGGAEVAMAAAAAAAGGGNGGGAEDRQGRAASGAAWGAPGAGVEGSEGGEGSAMPGACADTSEHHTPSPAASGLVPSPPHDLEQSAAVPAAPAPHAGDAG